MLGLRLIYFGVVRIPTWVHCNLYFIFWPHQRGLSYPDGAGHILSKCCTKKISNWIKYSLLLWSMHTCGITKLHLGTWKFFQWFISINISKEFHVFLSFVSTLIELHIPASYGPTYWSDNLLPFLPNNPWMYINISEYMFLENDPYRKLLCKLDLAVCYVIIVLCIQFLIGLAAVSYRGKKVRIMASPAVRSVNKSRDTRNYVQHDPEYAICFIFTPRL